MRSQERPLNAPALTTASSNQILQTTATRRKKHIRKNVFCLAAIDVKEGIVERITKIVGRDITNPILQTTDNINFKSVDQFQIHQLFTVITEGARYQS